MYVKIFLNIKKNVFNSTAIIIVYNKNCIGKTGVIVSILCDQYHIS